MSGRTNDMWLEAWQNNNIGFHQSAYQHFLKTHWDKIIQSKQGESVFVPLCGKSLDMIFLAKEKGLNVVGVELSDKACELFFQENQLDHQRFEENNFLSFQHPQYTLYCGDLFDLTSNQLENVKYAYDRAALIALPPQIRSRYVAHILENSPSLKKYFLITLDYGNSKLGPPFSVSDEEVQKLFGNWGKIEIVASETTTNISKSLQEHGINKGKQTAWCISR